MSKDNVKNAEPAKLDTEVTDNQVVSQTPDTSKEPDVDKPVENAEPAKAKDSVKEKSYVVVYGFIDKNDRHAYAPGDVFPFDGRKVDGKRIVELCSKKNDTNVVLIKEL